MIKGPICESCGMPLAKDPEGGATLPDGSTSTQYCSLCYRDGALCYKGTDVKEFQAHVVNKMVENGWWRPVAWVLTLGIPNLPRWKTPK